MINTSIKQNLVEQETRQKLLKQLEMEKPEIVAAMERFYSQPSRTQQASLQALAEVLAALDRVINQGDWDSSLFLRNVVKPLRTMRDATWKLSLQLQGKIEQELIKPPQLGAGMTKIYISIFQNKAHNFGDWEQQLTNLSKYIVGRPIYRDEKAIRQSIRSKLMQTSDAYVCVGVLENAIQSAEYHPTQIDRGGNTLLQLIPGAVQSENILEFVYMDKHYYFISGKLIEIPIAA